MNRRSIPMLDRCAAMVASALRTHRACGLDVSRVTLAIVLAACPLLAQESRSPVEDHVRLWLGAGGGLVFMVALWAAYRWRARQIVTEMNLRFEDRLRERTRVAGELHDSILQGLLSASMQLEVAADSLPPDSPVKHQLNHILGLMSRVSEEGRQALQGLRGTDGSSMRLEQAFAEMGQEFAHKGPHLRVAIEGQQRPLQPVLRDEVYRIGREALRNAFRHSGAKNIRVEIEYSRRAFRLEVRDDGRGIDHRTIRSDGDRSGGLRHMRERSESIGARLRIWSRAERGTKVELLVPARIAFRLPKRREDSLVRAVPWTAGFYRR